MAPLLSSIKFPQSMLLELQSSYYINPNKINNNNNNSITSFSSRCNTTNSKPNRFIIKSALVQSLPVSKRKSEPEFEYESEYESKPKSEPEFEYESEYESGYVSEYMESEFMLAQKSDPHEDPRLLREIWKEIQGRDDWEGLLDPIMNSHLRNEVLRYGEFAQSCYDSFDFDPHSKYCGSCKYPRAEFFEKMDMGHYGYEICRYLYATSNINLEKFFQRSRNIRSIWSPHANWMGYVAVTHDEEEIKRLGRRDILISWRGTVTYLEWIHDLKNILRPAHFRDNPHVQIESGFYDLYTTKEENCKYCSFSAREQVLAEVKRLVERFKGEELSITITGHSLGGALALLSAYDVAEMRLNTIGDAQNSAKKIPITVFSFASPRVGNLKFKERCDELGIKQLRVVNVHDKVPTMPGLIANEKNKYQKYLEEKVHFPWSYAHVGVELPLDHTHSPFLKQNGDLGCAHNLEGHLHLVDGYHGKGKKFCLATKRDIALVNKDSNFLKSEYGVPPKWRQDHNKGMVRNSEGRWVVPERALVEHHPPAETAHHFALAMEFAHDPRHC